MKKLVSFLLIFLFVGLCAFLAFEPLWVSAFSGQSEAASLAVRALCADAWGNAYYIANEDGTNTLYTVDDAGNIITKRAMDASTFGPAGEYAIQGLYVAKNKNIAVVTARLQAEGLADCVSVHLLEEDGSYLGCVLNRPLETPVSLLGEGVRVSSFSEDDAGIYFALLQNETIECFTLSTEAVNATGVVEKTRAFESPGAFSAFYARGGGEVLFALRTGEFRLCTPQGNRRVLQVGRAHATAFYQGQEARAYYRDAYSGGLYQIDIDAGEHRAVAGGQQLIDREHNIRLRDLSFCWLNQNGRLAAVLQQGDGQFLLYTGGVDYAAQVRVGQSRGNLEFLALFGIAAAAVLVSVLLFQVFCHVMKMRLSMAVRQTALIVLCVLATLYGLSNYVIRPNTTALARKQFEEKLVTATQTVAVTLQVTPDEAYAGAYFAALADAQSTRRYDVWKEDYTLIASSTGAANGTQMSLVLGQVGVKAALEQAPLRPGETGACSVYDGFGSRLYVFGVLENGWIVTVGEELAGLNQNIADITGKSSRFLLIAGIAMVLILVLVECATVWNIRKLKKGVDAVSAGNFNAKIEISSGDEIEQLSSAFNAMTKVVRRTIHRLDGTNRALYRFVPESLVQLLGANSIQELSRDTHVQREMTVLHMRFWIADAQDTSEGLFHDINEVIGSLMPAIPHNGGTVYGFAYDGFQTVFEGDRTHAVRAAVQMRELASALNAKRAAQNKAPVDVRIALGTGAVMLGVVGDEHRLSPVAVSGAIQAAAEIVEISRHSGVYIACTQSVLENVEGYRRRNIGMMRYGNSMLEIYDVYDGDPLHLAKHKQVYATLFEEARTAFYERDFTRARGLFLQIVRACPDDGVAKNYMYYADKYQTEEASGSLQYRLFE